MSTRDQLNSYLRLIEKRLRLSVLLRGAAILTSAALMLTVLLALITNSFGFSSPSLMVARGVLFVVLTCALGFTLFVPLRRLSRRGAAGRAEAAVPEFQQRLVTLAERQPNEHDPFMELLAADTVKLTGDAQPERLVPDGPMRVSVAGGGLSLGILVWMIAAGPGFLGYGAARLWTGASHGAAPFYDIRVNPGDAVVRRNASQMVTAQLMGFQSENVRLYARYQSASKWTQVTMQPHAGGSGFQFLFAGLPEDVEYYVEAGPLHSRHYNLHVVDLPSIKRIRVTYHFPSWTGLKDAIEEQGGDLHAVTGTQAGLEIFTDRPVRDGILVLDNNQQVRLAGGQANRYTGAIHIEKDGLYHVAVLEQQQPVRLSDDYFIEAREARAPEVRITRPGGDYRASPIEEVTVAAEAGGEYALNALDLHYSVNGGPERVVNMLQRNGAKGVAGSTTLSLENFKLVPGDLVSFYATANDARSQSRTDMFFIQAEPFEREYSQSQIAGGGGGGMGSNELQISQREKEIIAATWKQQGNKIAQEAADASKFLSDVQSKLRTQTQAIAGRLRAHGLTVENEELAAFQRDMNAAADAMGPAAEKLRQQKWTDALPREQKALQHLLQAEATFRRIEVAFGNGGAGGGGAGSGRDLANLLDLELDTEKNQYETEQTAASRTQRAQATDEALRKLDELARRQQELAERSPAQKDFQQRWQQEMLRREAERLQQQLEQLAQGRQQNGGQSGGQVGSGQSQQASAQRLERALNQLRQANEDMKRAASPGQNAADARRAADRLREATNQLAGLREQAASERLDSLTRAGRRLQSEQREQASRMRQLAGQKGEAGATGQSGASADEQRKLAEDRERLGRDLSRLEGEMGAAQRDLASTERRAAGKLGEAREQMKKSELQSNVQRSVEAMRHGKNPTPDSESAIASGMDRLTQQLQQARQALGGQQENLQAALDRVEHLREQMNALARNPSDRNRRNGQAGSEAPGGQRSPTRAIGREPGGAPAIESESATGPSILPERAFQQTLRELNEMRREIPSDPEAQAEIEALQRELERQGYRQYTGDPALVEQLRARVLAGMDKLELQLRQELNGAQEGQVRNGDSLHVPPGYQEQVAEYFRRLSKGHQ